MKRLLYPILLLFFAVATQAQNIPSYVPTNGLVGWWPFNGNANDESGNGNHGVNNNSVISEDRFGIINSSYLFNGSNSEISISSSLLNLGSNFTISCWMSSSDISKRQQCIFNSINHTGFVLELNNENIPTNKIMYGVGPANAFWSLIYAQGTFNQFQNNVWYHAVFVKSGTTYTLYLNNLIDGNSIVSSSIGYNQNVGIRLGSIGGSEFFKGKIDDIAIYNRALTQQEITALYTGVVTKDILAFSSPNGSITPTGTTTLNQGSTQSYTFKPNTGYLVDSVIVDGNKVDSIQGYTFSNISANHSIRVTFKIDSNNVSMNFPTGISYQAVARDSAGKVLANSPVKLRFSIKENSMNGNTVYAETANLTTNKLGLFTCIIGNNNATNGNYKNLDWMGASKFLQVELEQGNSFVLLGTQQLLSVPYANAAKTSSESLKAIEAMKIKNAGLPVYPDNNAALQGGMQAGEMYRTAAGDLKIVY